MVSQSGSQWVAVSTLKRPSGLAPLLAVSASSLSINLAWGLHCPSRWSLQVMASAPRCIHEGRSGVAQEAERTISAPAGPVHSPLKAVFSSAVNLTSTTTTKWAIKISRMFVCLLLTCGHFFFSFWVLKGPLLGKCWWDQKGLLCILNTVPMLQDCALPSLSTESVLERWGAQRTSEPQRVSDAKDLGWVEGDLSENWQATCWS